MVNAKVVEDRLYRRVTAMISTWNRAELCRKSGVPESTLATQISRGRFSLETIIRLAPVLGTSVGQLVEPEIEIPNALKARAFDQIRTAVRWAEATAGRADGAVSAHLAEGVAPRLADLGRGAVEEDAAPADGPAQDTSKEA